MDILNGRIDAATHGRLHDELIAEREAPQKQLDGSTAGDDDYVERGVQLLELLQRADDSWLTGDVARKGEILGCVSSNSTYGDQGLSLDLQQPFAPLWDMAKEWVQRRASNLTAGGDCELWYPQRRKSQTTLATSFLTLRRAHQAA